MYIFNVSIIYIINFSLILIIIDFSLNYLKSRETAEDFSIQFNPLYLSAEKDAVIIRHPVYVVKRNK